CGAMPDHGVADLLRHDHSQPGTAVHGDVDADPGCVGELRGNGSDMQDHIMRRNPHTLVECAGEVGTTRDTRGVSGHRADQPDSRVSGGELGAALGPATGHDGAAGTGPHAQTEAVLTGTTTVVRLES